MTVFGFLILAMMLAVIPGGIAHSKGHSFFAFWLFGVLLLVVALPVAITLKNHRPTLDRRAMAHGGGVRCPYCAEIIRPQAKVCRFCGRDQPSPTPVAVAVASTPPAKEPARRRPMDFRA